MSGDGKGYLGIGAMFVVTIILGLGLVWRWMLPAPGEKTRKDAHGL